LGAATLFTPYFANQVKGAVVGAVSGPITSSAPPTTVSTVSPPGINGGTPQTMTITGTGLGQIQSAIVTQEDNSELPISAANVNVLNDSAIQVTASLPSPKNPPKFYSSQIFLVTKAGQRIAAQKSVDVS